MARRDPDDPGGKKSLRETEQQQEEQLLEQQRDRQQEQQQQRDAAQDALGNQAVQEMIGAVSAKAGEAGQGIDLTERKGTEGAQLDYGGDDVPVDAPITMEDLVRSWNPTTQRGQDKDPFREGLLTEELPPVDPALLSALGAPGPVAPRDAVYLTAEAAALDPGALVRTAARLARGSPLARCAVFLAAPPRPPLVDRRVPVVRTRALAFGALLAEACCEAVPPSERSGLRRQCRVLLELATRRRFLPALLDEVAEQKLSLPMAADLAGPGLAGLAAAGTAGVSPSVEQIEQLKATLLELAPRVGTTALVPELPAGPERVDDEEDDPLGLDAILAQGHQADPIAPQYEHLLAAAEKIAVATSRLRVEAAAAVLALASALGPAASGPLARRAVAELDTEAAKGLQLLVEIARAIQQRAVPPAGVRNGLRRAARGVDLAWTQLCGWLAGMMSAAVPPSPALPLPPPPIDDALEAALAEGRADHAAALLTAAPGLEAAAARGLLATEAAEPEEHPRIVARARAAGRPALGRWMDLHALLVGGGGGRRFGHALRLQQEAFQAGDDLTFAAVTQVLLDDASRTHPDRVAAMHLEACRRLLPTGHGAGLALLLRWEPPDEPDGPLG